MPDPEQPTSNTEPAATPEESIPAVDSASATEDSAAKKPRRKFGSITDWEPATLVRRLLADVLPPETNLNRGRVMTLLVGAAVLVVMIVVAIVAALWPKGAPAATDLGDGIASAAGLRGHLITRWDGKVQYQLHVEPVEPPQAEGFDLVAGVPPLPMYLNIRLMDVNGFALCGKQVLFHFDPRRAASPPPGDPPKKAKAAEIERIAAAQSAWESNIEQQERAELAREHGMDILENQVDQDGEVLGANTQGTLPCSADAYKKAYYWDISTNFPTIAQQDSMLDSILEASRARDKEEWERKHAKKKLNGRPVVAFVVQGDDRVTGFNKFAGSLEVSTGKGFMLSGVNERHIANSWATNGTLIHYRCNQQGDCTITDASSSTSIRGRLNN